MGVLLPSLVLASLGLLGTTAKLAILGYRRWQKMGNALADTVVSLMLWLLKLLLLLFSIVGQENAREIVRAENAREVLLSLANGALVINQYWWTWEFVAKHDQRLRFWVVPTFLCIVICVLLSITPLILKRDYETWHLAVISFFGLQYVALEFFYGRICWKYYRKRGDTKTKIREILLWNMALSLIALAATIGCIVAYVAGGIGFELSLWIKYMAAALWFLRWLLLQFKAILRSKSSKAISNIPSSAPKPPTSTGLSVTLPSPVRPHMSIQQPFEPNAIQRNSSEGAGYPSIGSSSTTHLLFPQHPAVRPLSEV